MENLNYKNQSMEKNPEKPIFKGIRKRFYEIGRHRIER